MGAFRDNFDLFSQFMISPLNLLFPVLVTALGCTPIFRERKNRYLVTLLNRIDIGRYLSRRALQSSLVTFVALFASVLVSFAVAIWLWPLLGNPAIRPDVYGMTPVDAAQDSLERSSFSQLLSLGSPFYGAFYAFWVGLAGAAFAAAGNLSLIWLNNSILALCVPTLLYFSQTILAALLNVPQLGIMYSIFPFGLSQSSPVLASLPLLAVVLAVGIAWVRYCRGFRDRIALS